MPHKGPPSPPSYILSNPSSTPGPCRQAHSAMLRHALLSVSGRSQGLQEALSGSPTAWALRLERILSSSSSVARAAQEESAAEAAKGAAAASAAAAAPAATAETPVGPEAAAARQGLTAPGIARILGFAGAIPFLALSPWAATQLPLWLIDPELITHSGLLQVGYGATILSFLGGVHWGVAMTNIGGAVGAKLAQERYLWSVIPCIMGWPTLVLPVTQAAGVQAALLGAVYFVDRAWAKRGLLPPWYMKLRAPLTVLAASGLIATAALDVPPGVLTGLASS